MQEEGEPDAFAAAVETGKVDPIVPVASADERQSVRPEPFERTEDAAQAMSIDIVAVARGSWRDKHAAGMCRHVRSFKVGDTLAQQTVVARRSQIVRDDIGQPEMRIAGAAAQTQARAPVSGGMPPLQDIALAELLRSMQEDLLAHDIRRVEKQWQDILQLVAIANGAATLVGADASPQA